MTVTLPICNLRNWALVTFGLKLFGQKSSLHRVVTTKSVKESEEISCISLKSLRSSFRKIQICNLRNGALVTFGLKLCSNTKSVKESEEVSYISLESNKSSFRFVSFRFAKYSKPCT